MQVPVQIDFQGMEPVEAVRPVIAKHLAQLESRFGRIIACRVVVRSPGEHHRTGGLYDVNIRLTLPGGKEVVVGRTPSPDERYGDLMFAIHNAFKRARRRLQDQARRIQGVVKVHEPRPIGTVVRLFDDYGFLESAEGVEIYFHRNSVLNGGFDRLQVGSRVFYVEEDGEKGPQASTVKPLGKHHGLLI